MKVGSYIRTEEIKRKNSISLIGRKLSDETKKKLSIVRKGRKLSEEHKRKISEGKIKLKKERGYINSLETRRKMSKAQKGRSISVEHRMKISQGALRGEKNHSWKGGVTPINQKIKNSFEYKLWREAVFKRDNYTCTWCGDNKGGNLNADHIKPFCNYPELRFAIDNGRTLCISCHRTTDTYGCKAMRKE